MTYVQSILITGTDLEGFRAVDETLPTTRPDGLIARYVGATPDGVALTAVWATKAEADRFGTEVVGPAVRRAHGANGGGQVVLDFEATDVMTVGASA